MSTDLQVDIEVKGRARVLEALAVMLAHETLVDALAHLHEVRAGTTSEVVGGARLWVMGDNAHASLERALTLLDYCVKALAQADVATGLGDTPRKELARYLEWREALGKDVLTRDELAVIRRALERMAVSLGEIETKTASAIATAAEVVERDVRARLDESEGDA